MFKNVASNVGSVVETLVLDRSGIRNVLSFAYRDKENIADVCASAHQPRRKQDFDFGIPDPYPMD